MVQSGLVWYVPAVSGRGLPIFVLLIAIFSGCGSSASTPTPTTERAERLAQARDLQNQADSWTKQGEAAETDLEDAIWREDHPAEKKAEAALLLSVSKVREIKNRLEALLAIEERRVRDERAAAR